MGEATQTATRAARPVDELALNRRTSAAFATVHSTVRAAGRLPTLGGGMRAYTIARRDGRGVVV